MKLESLVKPAVLTQPVYEPGRPIEDVARELGLEPASILKLASNENPLGPSPKALEAAHRALANGAVYPDGGCVALRAALAERYVLTPEQFVVGNGSNEIIELLGAALLREGDEVVMAERSFAVYKLVALLHGAKPVEVALVNWTHDLRAMARAITEKTRMVFVCSPNNPTGTANSEPELVEFARSLPEHVVGVFDEAYSEYLECAPDLRSLISEGRKIICLRTFSKIYGLAALRVGYGYASVEMCAILNRVRQPFNVNAVAQTAATAALSDQEWVERCARVNRDGVRQLTAGCAGLDLETVPSVANFLLVRVGDGMEVFGFLQSRGVIVRPMRSYGLAGWIRITAGTMEQNHRVINDLKQVAFKLCRLNSGRE